MDEPLGALDKKLREQMQIEIKLLHEQFGLTVLYVTHDQSEALTMSDRIAVFHDGRVVQQGTPDLLYSNPSDAFVAGFIGENNLLTGIVDASAKGCVSVALDAGPRVTATAVGELRERANVVVAIRPESVRVSAGADGDDNTSRAQVTSRIYLGDHRRLLADIGGGHTITVKLPAGADVAAGVSILLSWKTADCLAFPVSEAAARALQQASPE
jgi:putative spermidine/putrescine transport system ATP-binding protein